MAESKQKYIYERLGDHDFQQLIGALLYHQSPGFKPLPLRQADGGRDGVNAREKTVYQVKWSVNAKEKDPVSWLDSLIKEESEKIKNLAAAGYKRYVLATNVPSTGAAGTGTFDRFKAKLDEYEKEFGIEMDCLWREMINTMVDESPDSIKWSYAEMLAGWDLIRYLTDKKEQELVNSARRDLLRKVAAVHWAEDERVKFSQVEFEREQLTELFVDVSAVRLHVPGQISAFKKTSLGDLGGAAAYITSEKNLLFTLVRGAPGQGKSTLAQYVCQSHRAEFVPEEVASNSALPRVTKPRFPIRVDLSQYVSWVDGKDVFDESNTLDIKKTRRRSANKSTIEQYLAALLGYASGTNDVDAAKVQDLITHVPMLIVFDGLDEVGNPTARAKTVTEIEKFCKRSRGYAVPLQVIVTTRPNSSNLREPDHGMFEVISLSPLDNGQREKFLEKWCDVHNVRGEDGRKLRRNFLTKTEEPYISELVGNPMQLTILLFLLRQHGDATPDQRTELYDSYMELLLAREANKHPEVVRKYRKDLLEIMPFLGWYLQSRSEEGDDDGKMAHDLVKASMKHFQRTYGKPENTVDELFEAVSDRMWALTSKEENTFEFEVVSLREYFAAKFLYESAGEGNRQFDRLDVFRELLRRSYWFNTARFYAGNAPRSDIYVLEAGIEEELESNRSKQVLVTAWTLLTDGVFNSRPTIATSIVNKLTDSRGINLLLEALEEKEIFPLPEESHTEEAWSRLTSEISQDPKSTLNLSRIRILRELLGLEDRFYEWWSDQLRNFASTPIQNDWLYLGSVFEIAAGKELTVDQLSAEDGTAAQLILNTGMKPQPGSSLDRQLQSAVWDGQCSQTTSIQSEAAQIAVCFTSIETNQPAHLKARAPSRTQALQRLRKTNPTLAEIVKTRTPRSGEKGSTFNLIRFATEVLQSQGRCWISSEIVIMAASSPLLNGIIKAPNTDPFGHNGHPATLLEQTRNNKENPNWWLDQLMTCQSELEQAEWVLSLWSIASEETVFAFCGIIIEKINTFSPDQKRALQISANRISAEGYLKKRGWVQPDQNTALLDQLLAPRTVGEIRISEPSNSNIGGDSSGESLAEVARRKQWFKVDQAAVYR